MNLDLTFQVIGIQKFLSQGSGMIRSVFGNITLAVKPMTDGKNWLGKQVVDYYHGSQGRVKGDLNEVDEGEHRNV